MSANDGKHLSREGARFIAGWEGMILRPYNDSANNATIGIGHLIHFGPVNAEDERRYAGFNESAAIALLQADVREVERQLDQIIHRPLDQHEYDALISITFNCGPGVLEGNVGRAVNAGNMHEAAGNMLQWDHAGGRVLEGLRHRREAEARLLLEPEAAYVPADEARWIREYDGLVHRPRLTWAQKARRRALVRAMTQRRKVIWHLAQKSGWRKLNRAARYRALLARTEG